MQEAYLSPAFFEVLDICITILYMLCMENIKSMKKV